MRDAMMKSFRVRPAAQQLQCGGVNYNHSGHCSAGTECDDHVTQPGTSEMEQSAFVASDKLHCPPAATIPIDANAWQEGLVQPPGSVASVCMCMRRFNRSATACAAERPARQIVWGSRHCLAAGAIASSVLRVPLPDSKSASLSLQQAALVRHASQVVSHNRELRAGFPLRACTP